MSQTPRIPDDPEQCRRLLSELLARADALQCDRDSLQRDRDSLRHDLAEARRVLDATAADHVRVRAELAEAMETIALLRRYVYGRRRERHLDDDPDQGHLFDLDAITVEPEAPAVAEPEPAAANERPRPARTGRRTAFDHLPQVRIEHDLPEADKICSCCGQAKCRIGEDISRELEFVPAKLEVLVHVLPKYACPKCKDGVTSPPVPPKPGVSPQ
jgi:transposase